MKKRISSHRGSLPTKQYKSVTHEPSQSLINEMLALFNAGEVGLFTQKANEVIERWPKHPFGWKALGNLMLSQERFEDALKYLSKTLQLDTNDAQSFNNLGITNFELGYFDEAVANYRQAIKLKANYPQAYNNLGNVLKKLGCLEDAVVSFRKALELKEDLAEAHYNLGNTLKELGNLDEAEKSYKQALFLKPNYIDALSDLGNVFLKRKQFSDALTCFRKCFDIDPFFLEAHAGLSSTLNAVTPFWHIPMMNDSFRNAAYFSALQNAITPDTQVLEIGTGSGLLALMAATLGARHITTC